MFYYLILGLVLLAWIPATAATSKMYVTNPGPSNSNAELVVYDHVNERLISVIPTVPGASFVRLEPGTNRLWVFSWTSNKVEIFNSATDVKVDETWLSSPACDAVFDPAGKTCYMIHGSYAGSGDNTLTFFDVATLSPSYSLATGANPVSMAIMPGGSQIYVANRDGNSITIVDAVNRNIDGTIFAGVKPYSITLSSAGRYIFVANGGVKYGRGGGSSVSVISTATGDVVRVIPTENGTSDVVVSSDATIIAVSHSQPTEGENIWLYSASYEEDVPTIQLLSKTILQGKVVFGTLMPDGMHVAYSNTSSGGVSILDLIEPKSPNWLQGLSEVRTNGAAFVEIDVEREIDRRNAVIADNPNSMEAQKAVFEKAYLYKTLGDNNLVIASYNDVIDQYPNTIAETMALMELGDLCYLQDLVSNSADYYHRALAAYGEHLTRTGATEKINPELLLTAADRLAELSVRSDKKYFQDLFKLYEDIPARLQEFPELFFTFGVALKRAGDHKYAKRCFNETENRVIELMDEKVYREMRSKLDLVRSSERAVISATEFKRQVIMDGLLDEWKKADELNLDDRDDVTVNAMRWLDRSDISGIVRVGWDRSNLYVSCDVLDDKVFRRDDGVGDKIDIYIDARDGSGDFVTRTRDIDESVHRFTVVPPTSSKERFSVKSQRNAEPIVAGTINSSGWTFELKIPLAYLPDLDPSRPHMVGFGIELFDVDSPSAGDQPKIVGWVLPATTLFGPRTSELFGLLRF